MLNFEEMDVHELHKWYEDLQIREQQIVNTKEIIRRELKSRVKS